MTITSGYCTLAEYKAFKQVRGGSTSTDTADDAVVEDIIELVSRYIDGQTGRRFFKNSTDETRYFKAESGNKCQIDDLSAAPTSVSVDYDNSRSYTALTIAGDVELDPINALLDGQPYTTLYILPTSSAYFPEEVRNGVKIVGKFGYPAVPEDIKNLTMGIALNIDANRAGQVGAGAVSVTASGVVIRPQDVPSWGQPIIAYHRKYR